MAFVAALTPAVAPLIVMPGRGGLEEVIWRSPRRCALALAVLVFGVILPVVTMVRYYTFYLSHPQTQHNEPSSPPAQALSVAIQNLDTTTTSLGQFWQQHPNATLDDLWNALWKERWPSTAVAHWTILIPWSISILLGVVVPLVFSAMSYIQEDELSWMSPIERKERRIVRLVRDISLHQKTLEEDDLILPEDCNDRYDDEHVRWRIPLPGESTSSCKSTWRTVEGSCVVCFNPYVVGDAIVWAANPFCSHAFCQDCIVGWLATKSSEEKNSECPCCRQPFLWKPPPKRTISYSDISASPINTQ